MCRALIETYLADIICTHSHRAPEGVRLIFYLDTEVIDFVGRAVERPLLQCHLGRDPRERGYMYTHTYRV